MMLVSRGTKASASTGDEASCVSSLTDASLRGGSSLALDATSLTSLTQRRPLLPRRFFVVAAAADLMTVKKNRPKLMTRDFGFDNPIDRRNTI